MLLKCHVFDWIVRHELKRVSRSLILLQLIHHRCQYSSACPFSVMRGVTSSMEDIIFTSGDERLMGTGRNGRRIPNKISIKEPECCTRDLPVRYLAAASLFYWIYGAWSCTCPCWQSRGRIINIKAKGRAEGESRATSADEAQLLRNSCSLER